MTDAERRNTALDHAIRWNAMLGIICPGCLIKQAKQFDEFLLTGDVANVEHLMPDEDEQPQSAEIIKFDPNKVN